MIIEKPFGTDLDSSRALDATVSSVTDEDRVYRIDHFLGKEAVQNILALRFANAILESAWNSDHVESVQIDVPEDLGLEGRGSFYESTGCFRDMVTTHLCQVLGFVAMERPETVDADALREAKAAVFQAMRPLDRTGWCSASSTATATTMTSPTTRRSRPSSRSKRSSTTTGGVGCRSTSAPGRRWRTTDVPSR